MCFIDVCVSNQYLYFFRPGAVTYFRSEQLASCWSTCSCLQEHAQAPAMPWHTANWLNTNQERHCWSESPIVCLVYMCWRTWSLR